MAKILFNGVPTAQIDFEYTPDSDLPVILNLTGTAYSITDNRVIGYKLFIDGALVTTAKIFSNGNQTHRVLNAGLASYSFPFVVKNDEVQPVAIRIEPMNSDTAHDVNDDVALTLFN